MSRTKVAIVNSGLSLAMRIITYFLQFVYRTVLVYVLGIEYSGITGFCQSVIGLFALSELGISWAISYYLYKPLKEKDNETVAAIIYFLKRLYKWVGLFILIGGACVIPFLDNIIKGGENIEHLQIIFLLFLINSAASYLFFTYYQILAGADRKDYMMFLPRIVGEIITVGLQIGVIYFFHSFVAVVAISVCSTMTINYIIRRKVIKHYPFLLTNKDVKLNVTLKKKIVKYIKSTMLYKISLSVQTSSTTVIISTFIGIVTLGIYANYMLIVDTIRALILSIINPMTAVIGEMTTNSSEHEKYLVYNRLNFLMEWLSYFCGVCLFSLLTPFVSLWMGTDNTLPLSTIIIISAYFYVEFYTAFSTIFRSACGLNNIGKFRPLITATLNILLAILLVQKFGLNGILTALLVSRLTTLTWFEPWIVHKYVFNTGVANYYWRLAKNSIFTIITAISISYLVNIIWQYNVITFIIAVLICLIIPNIIFFMVHRNSNELKYYVVRLSVKNIKKLI